MNYYFNIFFLNKVMISIRNHQKYEKPLGAFHITLTPNGVRDDLAAMGRI